MTQPTQAASPNDLLKFLLEDRVLQNRTRGRAFADHGRIDQMRPGDAPTNASTAELVEGVRIQGEVAAT